MTEQETSWTLRSAKVNAIISVIIMIIVLFYSIIDDPSYEENLMDVVKNYNGFVEFNYVNATNSLQYD